MSARRGGVELLLLAASYLLAAAHSTVLAVVVLVVALMLIATHWPPTAERLPSIRVERSPGLAVRLLPPEGSGKKKLLRETTALSRDVHAYLRARPDSTAEALAEHQAFTNANRSGASEEETQRLWHAYTQKMTERSNAERNELAEQFGGRVEHLLREFEVRGLIEAMEAERTRWEIGSTHWIVSATNRLEGIARGL